MELYHIFLFFSILFEGFCKNINFYVRKFEPRQSKEKVVVFNGQKKSVKTGRSGVTSVVTPLPLNFIL